MEQKKFIEDWFERRFNKKPQQDESYFNEWVGRFEKGNPENYMDEESLKIFKEMKK